MYLKKIFFIITCYATIEIYSIFNLFIDTIFLNLGQDPNFTVEGTEAHSVYVTCPSSPRW